MRALLRAGLQLTLLLSMAWGEPAQSSGEDPTLLAIHPSRDDDALMCTVETRGLPGTPILDTLERGLPATLVLSLVALGSDGRERVRVDEKLHLEPDLWDQDFRLRTSELERRFPTLDDLIDSLTHLGPFACGHHSDVGSEITFFVDASLAIHPLGENRDGSPLDLYAQDETARERERSIGLGRLFRFLLGRGSVDAPRLLRARSGPWDWASLPYLDTPALADSLDLRPRLLESTEAPR